MGQLSRVYIWRLCFPIIQLQVVITTMTHTRWKISDKLLSLLLFFPSQHHVCSLHLSIFTSISFSLTAVGALMQLLVSVPKDLQFNVSLLSCSGAILAQIWYYSSSKCYCLQEVQTLLLLTSEFLCPGIHKQLTFSVLMGRVILCQLAILDIWYLIQDPLVPSVQIVTSWSQLAKMF